MPRIVKAKAFQSEKTVAVARSLLGKFLVRSTSRGKVARMIIEVEAYDGERDRACHARHGRTVRNAVMYGPGGVWYVYLCYGMHEMLNLVTGPPGYPAAVLIRGIEGARGPGRLTQALAIDRRLNGSACAPESGLWIEDRGVRLPRSAIQATPRIGVDYGRLNPDPLAGARGHGKRCSLQAVRIFRCAFRWRALRCQRRSGIGGDSAPPSKS
jgi:DNA-3-methyladenine glycosylase